MAKADEIEVDPYEPYALAAARIVRSRRLRAVLEVTGPCFGPDAGNAVKLVKELQDLLGGIHDCDVQLPEVAAFLELRRDYERKGFAARLAFALSERAQSGR